MIRLGWLLARFFWTFHGRETRNAGDVAFHVQLHECVDHVVWKDGLLVLLRANDVGLV